MSKIQCCLADVKQAIFVGGKNFGTRLDPDKFLGLKIFYDRTEKELEVIWNGVSGFVPSSAIACYIPGEPKARIQQVSAPQVAGIFKAQVDNPMSHVHAGPGHGKTRS